LMDASRQGILNGNNSKICGSFLYLSEDQVKRWARQQMNSIAKKGSGGNFTVGTTLPLKNHKPFAQVWHSSLDS